MRVSDKGLLEIAEHEGIVPAPYLDSVGVWTFGVGHTAAAGDPDPAKMPKAMPVNIEAAIDEALRVFRQDIPKYEDRVRRAIKVPLKQHEFDALVSFDFNTGGIFRAKLTKAINAGEANAARHFMGWVKPPEIRKRRMAEMRLFETGDYDANGDAIPVWRTDGNGRLRGVMRQISGASVLMRMRPRRVPLPPDVEPPAPTPAAKRESPLTAFLRALVALFNKSKKG
jgi:lysozyme